MPSWSDNQANLPDREAAIRSELTASGGGASLSSVLVVGNDGGGKNIANLADPVSPQDAATKNYADNITLSSILTSGNDAGQSKIVNLGDPLLSNDAATKGYVDTSIPAAANLSSVLGVGNDAGAKKIANLLDPTLAQDAATKHYVDTASSTTPNLSSVLGVGADAGAHAITNLGSPSASTDAATKGYVDSTAFNNQSGSTYTLVLADQGLSVTLTNATACTVTVPPNSSVAFPTGAVVYLRAGANSGTITVAEGAGVTIRNPYYASSVTSFTLAGQCAEVKLLKIGTDTWSLNGDVT